MPLTGRGPTTNMRWWTVLVLCLSLLVSTMVITTTVVASEKKVTLHLFLHWGAEFLEERQKVFDKRFEERHPNINVKYERVKSWPGREEFITMFAAGVSPDIVYVHCGGAQEYIRRGMLLDLTTFIERTEAFAYDDIFEVAMKPFLDANNHVFGIPYDAGPVTLHYNTDIFQSGGVVPPVPEWTLEQFLTTARKLTRDEDGDGNADQWGLARTDYWNSELLNAPVLSSFGGRLLNADETQTYIDSAESIAGLKWWIGLIHDYGVATPAPGGDKFFDGRAAMGFWGSWLVYSHIFDRSLPIDVGYAPKGPGGNSVTVAGSGFAISTGSEHPDASWLYLSEYLGKDGARYLWAESGRGSPARRSAWPVLIDKWKSIDNDLHPERYVDALESGLYLCPISENASEIQRVINEELPAAVYGETSVPNVAHRIADRLGAILKQ